MAKVHGKDTVVTLDGDDLSAYANNVEFTRTADSHDVTTFGNDNHVYNGGLGDGTCTVSGIYDSVASVGPRAIVEPLTGSTVELVHQPEGAGTGKPQRTVDVVVTSYAETAPVADMVTWTAQLQLSGAVNDTAQA